MMASAEDGSPGAALGAQDPERPRRKGLINWLVRSGEPQEAEVLPFTPGTQTAAGGARQLAAGLGRLATMRVEDVALPRAEIVAVPEDIALADLVAVFRDTGYSRLPVYRDTLDTPLGLVLLKDFALTFGFNGGHASLDLAPMLRPLLYVPPSMPISVLMTKMQAERAHMALVIDEYGGVDGLVTIEDIIEQIVGEIDDEHDTDDKPFWTEERPGTYLALARAPLEDFEKAVGMTLTEGVAEEEIETLGGLVFVLSGRVPARGEVIPHPAGPEFEVLDADPRRIKRLRVCLDPKPAE